MKFKNKILLVLFSMFLAIFSFSQKKIYSGILVYEIKYADGNSFNALLPTKETVYFKGDTSCVQYYSGANFFSTVISNEGGFRCLYIEIKALNKKYKIAFDQYDIEQMEDTAPQFNYQITNEIKTIAGYSATKHIVTDVKTNKSFNVWFSKEIAIPLNAINLDFDKSYGVPLEFDMVRNKITLHYTVKNLTPGTIPLNSFTPWEDYELMTFQQWNKVFRRQ